MYVSHLLFPIPSAGDAAYDNDEYLAPGLSFPEKLRIPAGALNADFVEGKFYKPSLFAPKAGGSEEVAAEGVAPQEGAAEEAAAAGDASAAPAADVPAPATDAPPAADPAPAPDAA